MSFSSANRRAEPTYVVGLDLGTIDDFTAISVVEVDPAAEAGQKHYRVSHLERWRHAPYPRIIQEVAAIVQRPPLVGRHTLLADATGVGVAVLSMIRQARLSPLGITITSGEEPGRNALGLTVPKSALVGALSVVVQTGRIKVARELPTGQTLASEMQAFTRRQNPVTGRNQFAVWREGEHDDVVLATALAVWYGERGQPNVRLVRNGSDENRGAWKSAGTYRTW